MAKRFGGFTPEQMGKIVPEMQGMQADEQARFLASQPGAAARVGKMSELAEKRINMAQGGLVKGYAAGGFNTADMLKNWIAPTLANADKGVANPDQPKQNPIFGGTGSSIFSAAKVDPKQAPTGTPQEQLDAAQKSYASAQKKLQDARAAQAANPTNAALKTAITSAEAAANLAKSGVTSAESAFKTTEIPTSAELVSGAIKDPTSLVTKADVATVSEADKAAGTLAEGTGKLTGEVPTATATEATATSTEAPKAVAAETYAPLEATAGVEEVMSRLEAATGKPSADAIVDAAQMDPQELSQLGLTVAQITEAQKVQAPDARTVQAGELVSGSSVDMERVKEEVNFEAATGAPSTDATVQGQLTGLMKQFEGNEPPAWAAGAMRQAAAMMASRGLSASSMAGQAAIQAAMESALPIAQIDAGTFAKFEAQNLSNKQQSAMFAAEKRAEFLGLEFNQEFQARVSNAAKISDIANMNFSAEQQVALENARMAQTVDLTNLNSVNAKIMADAASMSQADMSNLNNRQQAQVQNAKSFLDMDMANLNNNQQTTLFKAQQRTNTLLSDQAAMNAAKQFNTSSENQTNQFFSNLSANVALANTEQINATNRFNAGESNAISQYNATARTAREQFNANNALVVAQANAAWSQATTTTATAAQNQANRDAAISATGMTTSAYNSILQQERDMINYAFQMGESAADRGNSVVLQGMINSVSNAQMQANIDTARGAGWAKAGEALLEWWLNS